MSSRALALALLVAASACDAAERRDAESVLAAVSRFRSADHAATPAAVDALKATPCNAPDSCGARDACLAAGEPTARALRLKREVELGVRALEKGALGKESPEARALPAKLDEAEALLREGHEKLPACDERVQALKRKYRL